MMTKNQKNNEEEPKPSQNNSLKKYAALSGIGLQMGATIFICAWAGKKLDRHFNTEKGWFTIGLVLSGVAASLFIVIKQLKKINQKFDN